MTLSNSKLALKIVERKEFVGSIEIFIVLAVAALDPAIAVRYTDE